MKTKMFKYGLFFLILFFGVALTSCDDKDKDEEKEEVVFDERIEKVLPEDIRVSVERYMPLFLGVNPPNVEGTYYIDPYVSVYCEDEGFEPGHVVASYNINFSNQNMRNNTIDMSQTSSNFTDKSDGKGVFISGSDDKFTAYFSTTGISSFSDYDVYYKTSVVISGKKTKNGIKDFYYAFVMLEKSDDPENYVMDEGYFRIFKDEDGLSEYSSLPDDINQLPRNARLVKEGNINTLYMSANAKKYKQ